MSEDNQKKQDSSEENVEKNQGPKEEKSLEEKLKESDDKLLRSLAEIESMSRMLELNKPKKKQKSTIQRVKTIISKKF